MTTLRPSRSTSAATRSEGGRESSRRDLIQLLGAGLMVTPSLALASEPSPRTSRAVERILVDERFPESEAFAVSRAMVLMPCGRAASLARRSRLR